MVGLTPNPTQQKDLRGVYATLRIAHPRVGNLPKVSVTKNNIKGFGSVTIHYDKYGFPKFEDWIPLPKKEYAIPVPKPRTGRPGDINHANKMLEAKYAQPNHGLKQTYKRGTGNNFSITGSDGVEVFYTWHHHQDGKTLIPIPTNIHNSGNGGFSHTGGDKLLDKGLEGIFEGPDLN